MLRRGLNTWLVGLGVLIMLFGILDAAGVVGAIPPVIPSHSTLTPTPPEDFGQRGEVEAQVDGAGFLPMQAPSEPTTIEKALPDPRLLSEMENLPGDDPSESRVLPPAPPPEIPRRLWIPAIDLYVPILPMEVELVEIDGVEYDQWVAPNEKAAGWHASSTPLGAGGNTVLNGHHNIYGEVFRDLVNLKEGDEVILYSDNLAYRYQVVERVIFPERFAKPEQRVQNAKWILPTQDERVTLITCWPYESNTHRLILVAKPVLDEQ